MQTRNAKWLVLGQVAAVACVVALLGRTGVLTPLEHLSVDWRFIARGVRPPTEPIVIVEIDQVTLEAIPDPWVFWGTHHAKVTSILHEAGVRAIGFDVVQPISLTDYVREDNDPDQQWAQALAQAPETVLTYVTSKLPDGEVAVTWPTEQLRYALVYAGGRMGFTTTIPDADQVVRRHQMAAQSSEHPEMLSFPLAMAAMVRGVDVSLGQREVRLGEQRLQTDEGWLVHVNFRGPDRTFPHIRYVDLLRHPDKFRDQLKDAIVLIGNTALDFQDYHTVPFSRRAPERGVALMSGTEVLANVLHQILTDDYLRVASPQMVWWTTIAAFLLSALVFNVSPPRVAIPAAALLPAVWGAVAYVAFVHANVQLPVALPIATMLLAFAGGLTTRLVNERRERQEVTGLFGRYVDDSVVQYLLENPEATAFGQGHRRPVTVLFSDIRGFTAMSEEMEPEQVTQVLNEYLTRMVDVVFAHGGTVDKYIGDAVMAVFNWPVTHADHADRAVSAALAMQSALEELCQKWQNAHLPGFAIGVGVNSGEAVLGNIGSPRRMEHTAIGDTVNLASRLESLNKDLGTNVLISSNTHALLSTPFQFGDSREVHVKGRTEPVVVYPVIGVAPSDPTRKPVEEDVKP